MTTDDLLVQRIASLRAGWKAESDRLQTRVVQQNEHSEMAWVWPGGGVDTDKERRTCLEKVLVANPNNGIAQRGLETLRRSRSSLDSTPDSALREHGHDSTKQGN